jgi:hypothetical protein
MLKVVAVADYDPALKEAVNTEFTLTGNDILRTSVYKRASRMVKVTVQNEEEALVTISYGNALGPVEVQIDDMTEVALIEPMLLNDLHFILHTESTYDYSEYENGSANMIIFTKHGSSHFIVFSVTGVDRLSTTRTACRILSTLGITSENVRVCTYVQDTVKKIH